MLSSPAQSSVTSSSNSLSTISYSGPPIQHARLSPPARTAGIVPPADRSQTILSVPSAGILFESSERVRSVGFLGQTSSTVVVAELNNSLGINVPELPNEPRSEGVSDACVRRGVQVLSYFRDENRMRQSLDQFFNNGDGEGFLLFRPVYFAWLDYFLPVVKDASSKSSLEALSAKIWLNTQKSVLCDRATTALDWALATTGENVRWETLGLLLSLTGVGSILLPSSHPTPGSGSREGRLDLRQNVLDLVNLCVEFSKASGSRNDLLALLLCVELE